MQDAVASCYPTECVTTVTEVRAAASGLGAMVQGSVSSEVAALRREVSTLRVADSQLEVQNAEITRSLREVQATIRQDFESRLEVTLRTQDRFARDIALMQEELAKVVHALEVERRERNLVEERARMQCSELRAVITEDKAFLQRLKVDFEDELKLKSTQFDVDLRSIASTLNERNASCEVSLKQAVANTSEQILQDVRCQLAQNEKSVDASLRKAIADEAANHKLDIAAITTECAGLRSMLELNEAKMGEQIDANAENLRAQFTEVRGFLSSFTEDYSARNSALKDTLEQSIAESLSSMKKLEEAHAKSNSQRASEIEALNEIVEGFDSKYFCHLTEHQQLLDNLKDRWEDQVNRKHNFLNDRLADLELKLKSSHSQLLEDQGCQQASLLELEQRLQKELCGHGKELQERFLDLRSLLDNASSEHSNTTRNIESSLKAFSGQIQKEVADHKRHTDKQHDVLREHMAKAVEERHTSLLERLEEADKRVDPVPQKIVVEGMLSKLEQKLLDEIMSHSHEHHGNHQQLQDQMARLASEHSSKQMELNTLLGRISTQEKSARDEHRDQVNGALDALDERLRKELSAVTTCHDSMKEQLGLESQARERVHAAMLERIEDVERQSRDAYVSVMRKLQEEFMEDVGRKHVDLKNMVVKANADHNDRQIEMKESFGRLLAQEKSAREDLRSLLLAADDAVVDKFRKDLEETRAIADRACASLQEQLAKDRQDQDGLRSDIMAFSTSIAALERRCREELQARFDELFTIFFEFKEGVASMVASESGAREELRQGIFSAIDVLEKKLRRDLVDESTFRERTTQEGQVRAKVASDLNERFSELQRKHSLDLASEASRREAVTNQLKEYVVASCSQESLKVQELFIKESESRTSLEENLLKQLGQERAAREVQQETLRVYLAQDRAAREAPVHAMQDRIEALEKSRSQASKDTIGRTEFEGVLRRVWEVVDSHSYTLAQPAETPPEKPEATPVVQTVKQIPVQMVQMPVAQQKPTILVTPLMQPVATMAGVADIRKAGAVELKTEEAMRMRSPSPMFRSRGGS